MPAMAGTMLVCSFPESLFVPGRNDVPPLLRKLGLALLLAAGVVLLTLAVLTISPLFAAVTLALSCALAGWAGRPTDPEVERILIQLRETPEPVDAPWGREP